jgi:hypothetical protein
MVKMLSINPAEVTDAPLVHPFECDDARLEVAKRNLEHRVEVFGLQERFEAFCDDIAARYGWDLGEPRFANRSEPIPVSDELREQIASDSSYDVALYRFATRLSEARAVAGRPQPAPTRG